MLVTKQRVLRRFWYPVMPLAQLAQGPRSFTLLGEPIVLWRRASGGVACLKDRCRHRTAKLSAGYLEDGNIVCGYHGWTYDAEGACRRIPQSTEDARMIDRVRVTSYRAAERYGYAWVALAEPLIDIPDLPEAGQLGFRQVDQFYESWNIGALRLMENSFDSAHIAFVHRDTFGNVERAGIVKRELSLKAWGFDSVAVQPVKVRGALAHRAVHNPGDETVRRTESSWYMPFVRRAAIHYPDGLVHVLVTCATPMLDDRTMILQWVYRNDSEAEVSAADVIGFDRAITFEDKAILETCDPDVPLAATDDEEMHMGSDRPGLVMRQMFGRLLREHGEAEIRAGG